MKEVRTVIKGVLDDFFVTDPIVNDDYDHSFLGVIIEDKDILATAIKEALEKQK